MKTSEHDFDVAAIVTAVNRRFQAQSKEPLDHAVIYEPTRHHPDEEYRLVLGGCQYPAGLLDAKPAYAAYQRLAMQLDRGSVKADVLLLTGDQIYVDATAGLFDPTQLDDNYRRSYERWLSKAAVRDVTRRIATACMLDDHEIFENYEPLDPHYDQAGNDRQARRYQLARRHYLDFQRKAGPDPQPPSDDDSSDLPLWFTLQAWGLPVFVTDTRTEREHRNAGRHDSAHIMTPVQMRALKSWLLHSDNEYKPKIIASASILLPRHTRLLGNTNTGTGASSLLSDSWDGYPASLRELLAFIVDRQIQNVVFVSGDEHLGCACRVVLRSDSQPEIVVHSIHTSALYAPYPFANARQQDLLPEDTFDFKARNHNGDLSHYHCHTAASFYPGEGFTILNFRQLDQRWELNCSFDRAADNSQHYRSLLGA